MRESSAGQTRGLIEALKTLAVAAAVPSLPRVRPAASLKLRWSKHCTKRPLSSSAGQTRGLIEAKACERRVAALLGGLPRVRPAASLKRVRWRWLYHALGRRLPRVRPAASLKHRHDRRTRADLRRLPRVRPAASLKHTGARTTWRRPRSSSAGQTRGLIEARRGMAPVARAAMQSSAGQTRGLIEASAPGSPASRTAGVFRGSDPRPH